jgi:hypothetical protein
MPKVVEASGGHFAGDREFATSAPRIERPFLIKVVNARGNDGFYQERVSLEAIARSLSMLNVEGAFGEQDYDLPDF